MTSVYEVIMNSNGFFFVFTFVFFFAITSLLSETDELHSDGR